MKEHCIKVARDLFRSLKIHLNTIIISYLHKTEKGCNHHFMVKMYVNVKTLSEHEKQNKALKA